MKSNPNKRRREKLMAEDSHCHWCGQEVIYYNLGLGERMPSNFATIDHLLDKLTWDEETRAIQNRDESSYVLACNACNKKRSDEAVKAYGKEAWTLRSRLGEERKRSRDPRPRTQVFRGLENI